MTPSIFAAGAPWFLDSNFVVMLGLVLFLAVVYRYGWPIIRDMLDGQINTVKSDLDEASRLRDEAKALLTEYEAKHKKALSEAKAIVKAAEADAEALRDKAEADLKISLKRREAAAKARIEQAEATAVSEAKASAAAQAIAAAEKMLADKLDDAADGDLISEAIGLVPGRFS